MEQPAAKESDTPWWETTTRGNKESGFEFWLKFMTKATFGSAVPDREWGQAELRSGNDSVHRRDSVGYWR